jgi:hypothetical protein
MAEGKPEHGYPITAPRGSSAAEASQPDTPLDGSFHIYESHPVPWWLTIIWLSFFVFGVVYLIMNLLE